MLAGNAVKMQALAFTRPRTFSNVWSNRLANARSIKYHSRPKRKLPNGTKRAGLARNELQWKSFIDTRRGFLRSLLQFSPTTRETSEFVRRSKAPTRHLAAVLANPVKDLSDDSVAKLLSRAIENIAQLGIGCLVVPARIDFRRSTESINSVNEAFNDAIQLANFLKERDVQVHLLQTECFKYDKRDNLVFVAARAANKALLFNNVVIIPAVALCENHLKLQSVKACDAMRAICLSREHSKSDLYKTEPNVQQTVTTPSSYRMSHPWPDSTQNSFLKSSFSSSESNPFNIYSTLPSALSASLRTPLSNLKPYMSYNSQIYPTGKHSNSQLKDTEFLSNLKGLEHIIVLDERGGIPLHQSENRMHLFVNLLQEYDGLEKELKLLEDDYSLQLLKLMRDCLELLPESCSGISVRLLKNGITTNTLRNQDTLQYNKLNCVEKYQPAEYELFSYLISGRASLSASMPIVKRELRLLPTIFKLGYPVRVFNRSDLTSNEELDIDKIMSLLENSFGNKLNREKYLERIRQSVKYIVVIDDYEGCAIITEEHITPRKDPRIITEHDSASFIYLDKFSIARTMQGKMGVSDVLFNAVTELFSDKHLYWRSRKNNPVNMWYFERSVGSLSMPDSKFRVFWTQCGHENQSLSILAPNEIVNHIKSLETLWIE